MLGRVGIRVAGQIKRLIDDILKQNAKGDNTLLTLTRTKMILMGVNPAKYTESSEDDPLILTKLEKLAKELNGNGR